MENKKRAPAIGAIETFLFIFFSSLVIIVFLQVIFRFVLQISVPWTEEVARVMYIWLTFIGLILVEAENAELKTTYFLEKLPGKVQTVMRILINAASMIFIVALFIGSLQMIPETLVTRLGSLGWVPTAILYVPVVLSCPFICYYLISNIVRLIKTGEE